MISKGMRLVADKIYKQMKLNTFCIVKTFQGHIFRGVICCDSEHA